VLDDNILGIWRRWRARKIRCDAEVAFRAVEDFVDRYENVAIAGMNYYMFAINKLKQPAFNLNVHVYSCLLIATSLPHRWRGRYNEDTDLCLQVLSDGWCTVLFNAFLCWKMTTMTMKGGNTTELYRGDGRLKMARSLERAWPGVVETKRRFQRPQHVVKGSWRGFDTPLRRRSNVDFEALARSPNEYGMTLEQLRETKSPELRAMIAASLAGEDHDRRAGAGQETREDAGRAVRKKTRQTRRPRRLPGAVATSAAPEPPAAVAGKQGRR
jgi:hypothetical protein